MFFRRLWFTYLIIITISLLITAIVTGSLIFNKANNDVQKTTVQLVSQTALGLSDLFVNMKNTSNSIAMNATIQSNLTAEGTDIQAINNRIANINNELLYQGIFNNQYSSAELFIFNGEHYPLLYLPNRVMNAAVVKNKAWYQKTVARRGKYYWCLTKEFGIPQISLLRVIGNLKKYNTPIAVLKINIDLAKLSSSLAELKLCKTGKVYLLDEHNDQIYPYSEKQYQFGQLSLANDRGNMFVNINGKRMMITYQTLLQTNWKLVGMVPADELSEKAYILKMIIYSIAFISFILALCATFFFSYNIARPITKLAETMVNYKPNCNSIKIDTKFKGEVGLLYNSFNGMVKMINELIQKEYLTKVAQKNAELRALQAQINPHFLYNTLNSIHWIALKYNAQDISKMVLALCSLLRYSLNEMGKMISLREEIQQLNSYITIQKIRYPDQFTVVFDVEEIILDCKVVKLILQPLVENAIIHGIEHSGEHGLIELKGHLEGKNVILQVINNGNMIDLAKVNALLSVPDEIRGDIHAIQNVNDRIKLNYGDEYGLQYFIMDRKTVAQIRIPAMIATTI